MEDKRIVVLQPPGSDASASTELSDGFVSPLTVRETLLAKVQRVNAPSAPNLSPPRSAGDGNDPGAPCEPCQIRPEDMVLQLHCLENEIVVAMEARAGCFTFVDALEHFFGIDTLPGHHRHPYRLPQPRIADSHSDRNVCTAPELFNFI